MVLLALVMVVIGTIQVTRVTAGSRAEEHENEAVVYRNGQACGVERWSVKTGTDAGARSINLGYHFPTAISRLSALTAPSSLPSSSRVRPVETTVYTLTGTLLRYKEEQDSDYHLVISDGQHTMIAEIPASYCVGANSPWPRGLSTREHSSPSATIPRPRTSSTPMRRCRSPAWASLIFCMANPVSLPTALSCIRSSISSSAPM
jgi:hypothetical protein